MLLNSYIRRILNSSRRFNIWNLIIMDQQNHQYYLEFFLIKELIFLKFIRLTDYKI
jgi:hypothetical protein